MTGAYQVRGRIRWHVACTITDRRAGRRECRFGVRRRQSALPELAQVSATRPDVTLGSAGDQS
jgi:hypothetical protein